jgi:hypothetical protein
VSVEIETSDGSWVVGRCGFGKGWEVVTALKPSLQPTTTAGFQLYYFSLEGAKALSDAGR